MSLSVPQGNISTIAVAQEGHGDQGGDPSVGLVTHQLYQQLHKQKVREL